MNDTALQMTSPSLPQGASIMRLRGVSYLGNRCDITLTASTLTVLVRVSDTPVQQQGQKQGVRRSSYVMGHLSPVPPSVASMAGLSALPADPLPFRDQHSRVVIDGYNRASRWTVAATPLVLVDASGGMHPLAPGVEVALPLQSATIQSA